jgi:hypothetical protein
VATCDVSGITHKEDETKYKILQAVISEKRRIKDPDI